MTKKLEKCFQIMDIVFEGEIIELIPNLKPLRN